MGVDVVVEGWSGDRGKSASEGRWVEGEWDRVLGRGESRDFDKAREDEYTMSSSGLVFPSEATITGLE